MEVVNIHEAKTHLSRLIERAVKGESFIIAKAGKPLVKVEAISPQPPKPMRRLGFLEDRFAVPDDFKAFGRDEIEAMFHGEK